MNFIPITFTMGEVDSDAPKMVSAAAYVEDVNAIRSFWWMV
jgi:hypothetical protein